ncbi:hypothetical protein TWF730_006440 [Orbilia blumenaviensis]|uniref:NADP-dependent oxidoreductase domain-containing protein n=1 Tax=Orbilia blumenaviensis TaxID=1796055 RepID=A0AAV9VHS2_9PEZI
MLRPLSRARIRPPLRSFLSTHTPIRRNLTLPQDKLIDEADYSRYAAALEAAYPTYTPTVDLRPPPSITSKRQIQLQNLIDRPIPTIPLSNGLEIPAIGYQAYTHRDHLPKVWKERIWRGYRYIDMNSAFNAPSTYLQSSFWSLASRITRSDLFISAKLDSWWHHDPKASLYHTLQGLRTGYLDLWIMRWPVSWISKENRSKPPKNKDGREVDFIQAWKGMEEQVDAGKVKCLGISGFSKAELDLLMEHAKHKPVVHQMEITPYLQQTEFVEYNKSLGIVPIATIPIGERSADKGELYRELIEDPLLASIAEKHRITTKQVIVAWHLANSIVSVPFIDSPDHAFEVLAADRVTLDDEDLEAIAALEKPQRLYKPKLLGYFPFSDLTDSEIEIEGDDLPNMEDVYDNRRKRVAFARALVEQEVDDEITRSGDKNIYGTTTYAGTVFGWVRSVDGSRKARDNKTGHFGTSLRPPKKRKR